MDSAVLAELLTALPEWASKLQQCAAKFPDSGASTLTPINPGPELTMPSTAVRRVGRQVPPSLPEDEVVPKIETGPDIYYDGESQKCLFDCWTALNSKRGVLRKEMMLIRRKKVLALPIASYGYGDSDDELEADDASEREETEEDRQRKAEEERLRLEEAKKKEEDERKSKILEYIDGCLDKAARACENAATVWLKGEGCMGHVVFITARMMEAAQKINTELKKNLPDDQGYDEGFEEDLEVDNAVEEELPHKKAAGDGQRPVEEQRPGEGRQYQPPPSSPQPVEVAG